MKWEAKSGASGKGVESRSTGLPVRGNISQEIAINYCRNLGPGYALINNAEWMTIAANIAGTAANWSGAAVGSGYINSGHNDSSPDAPCDGSNQYVDGNCANSGGETAFSQKRTHSLSNGEIIWDFAGNVWEWVDTFVWENKPTPIGDFWQELSVAAGTTNFPLEQLRPTSAVKPFWNNTWNSAQGIGQYWPGWEKFGGAMQRGGGWPDNAGVGVFTAALADSPSDMYEHLGLRCVWRRAG